jgi:hypothetical protein
MTIARALLAASLGSTVLLAAGCAHAPQAATQEKPVMRVVTGSRIPQPVDPKTGVVLSSISPVTVYTLEDVRRTGQADLAAAVNSLGTGR